MTKPLLPVMVMLGLCLSLPALAQVPKTMSYQGVLTDGSGNLVADGFYDLTFSIYDVPVAGFALYTEAHIGGNHVQVTKGSFSVILGSLTTLSLPFDGPYYLGIQVGADPELSPRIPLASSPYALGLVLPFTLSATAGTKLITGADCGGVGGCLRLWDPAGNPTIRLEPNVNGSGGFFQVARNTDGFSNAGFVVDGNAGGTKEPSMFLYGSTVSAGIDLTKTGDASVQLPASSIDAQEGLDEPGVAQGHANFDVSFASATGANFADIVSATIATPAAGYIVLSADAQLWLPVTNEIASIQITESSGAVQDPTHYFYAGTAASGYVPVSIHRTYFKGAGSYTFYFQAQNTTASAGGPYAWNPTITAQYFPTGYGAVTTSPSAAELPQFDHVTPTSSPGNGPGHPPVSGALVDLHELELRAARAQAEAERAQRLLDAARESARQAGGVRR